MNPSEVFRKRTGPGAWAAAVVDINTRAALMFLRFRQGRWKQIKV